MGSRKQSMSWLGWRTAATVFAVAIGLTPMMQAQAATVTYQVVTNEIAAKQADGTTVEVYRFDPGVWVVQQGDQVALKIRGVKGHDHPILLEDYHLKTVVHRNQVTDMRFIATKPGMFRLLCTAHADAAHQGPMEGYLIVVPARH